MRRISLLAVPAALAAVVLAAPGASAAKGDGPQGQTEMGPQNSNSICSYSGLNDDPDHPTEGGQVQSYGQIIRHPDITPQMMREHGESPGQLCNGHNLPWQDVTGSH